MLNIIKLLRPGHWTKNSFVVLPIIFSGQYQSLESWIDVGIGFLLFNILASTVYIINDITDIPRDRLHPIKQKRPLASGAISLVGGILLSIALFALFIFFGTS